MTIIIVPSAKSWHLQWASFAKPGYNVKMIDRDWATNSRHLLRIALFLWIGYFLCLALLDWWLVERHVNVLLYYAVQMFHGLLLLGLTLLPWRRFRAEARLLPIVLVLMAILPSLTVHVMLNFASSIPLRSPEGMTLRLIPILLMGLLLTAWQYQWRQVVLFALGTLAVNVLGVFPWPALYHILGSWFDMGAEIVGPRTGPPPPRPMPTGGILVTLFQLLSLLIVGYITSALVKRLRQQQQALEDANAQLRDQANAQIELTITRERNRVARELHDTLAHTLSGLTVQLATVRAYWDVEPEIAQGQLDGALSATRDGLQETRRALKSLRATPLDDLGLSLAIRQQAETAAERANLALNLSIVEPLPAFSPEISHCIYRVAQEAITNVVYHANAEMLSVKLDVNGIGTQLTVADDGMGFEPNAEHANHWGIKGLHERAQLINGHLLISSERERGTTVQLTIPEKRE
ncbi:MAG: sensor histidine kinase [Chloroflexota bacterium]